MSKACSDFSNKHIQSRIFAGLTVYHVQTSNAHAQSPILTRANPHYDITFPSSTFPTRIRVLDSTFSLSFSLSLYPNTVPDLLT